MVRHIAWLAATAAALVPGGWLAAAPTSALIPETTAQRHGLTRVWFTQVQLDSAVSRIRDVVLDDGTLFVQTNRAMVHAINAETGQTLWAKQIGRPNHPSATPGLSPDLLVVLNGSRMYAINRANGDLLFETQVSGPPGAGAAVSAKRAYVPMVTGMIVAYRLESMTDPLKELGKIKEGEMTDEEKAAAAETRRENLRLRQELIPPLVCQSAGRALVQPLVTRQTTGEELVAWPTDRGYLHLGRINKKAEDVLAVVFRMETPGGVPTRPTYAPADTEIGADQGVLFVGSTNGFVYALGEKAGDTVWRFSAGEPVVQPPALIDADLYVAVQTGGMYCLDAKSGAERWWSPLAAQFISASKDRIYAADKNGRLLALSAKNGARLDTFAAVETAIKVANTENDRLYLVSETGLVQCLREAELAKPLMHNEIRRQQIVDIKAEEAARAKKPAPKAKGKEPAGEEPAAEQPPAEKKPAGGAEEDPFAAPKGGAPKGGAPKGGAPKGAPKEGDAPPAKGPDEDPFK